jgi:hypothetical protein
MEVNIFSKTSCGFVVLTVYCLKIFAISTSPLPHCVRLINYEVLVWMDIPAITLSHFLSRESMLFLEYRLHVLVREKTQGPAHRTMPYSHKLSFPFDLYELSAQDKLFSNNM